MKYGFSLLLIISSLAFAAEDCVSFNYNSANVQQIAGDWKIVDGSHAMFSFGTKEADARKSLEIIKAYRMSQSCFVGRPDPSFTYLLTGSVAPSGNLLAGEDCIAFNANAVDVRYFESSKSWKLIQGDMWIVDFGDKKQEAYDSLNIVRKYAFNQQCFVKRPNPKFAYWKKTGQVATRPDLGAYGFLKIGKTQKEVRWNDTITLTPGDATLFSNGVPAFEVYYADKNYGLAAANNYENHIKLDGALVSRQYNRTAAPGQMQPVHTQAYLKPSAGRHVLSLQIDGTNAIAESNEGNNLFQVTVVFQGF